MGITHSKPVELNHIQLDQDQPDWLNSLEEIREGEKEVVNSKTGFINQFNSNNPTLFLVPDVSQGTNVFAELAQEFDTKKINICVINLPHHGLDIDGSKGLTKEEIQKRFKQFKCKDAYQKIKSIINAVSDNSSEQDIYYVGAGKAGGAWLAELILNKDVAKKPKGALAVTPYWATSLLSHMFLRADSIFSLQKVSTEFVEDPVSDRTFMDSISWFFGYDTRLSEGYMNFPHAYNTTYRKVHVSIFHDEFNYLNKTREKIKKLSGFCSYPFFKTQRSYQSFQETGDTKYAVIINSQNHLKKESTNLLGLSNVVEQIFQSLCGFDKTKLKIFDVRTKQDREAITSKLASQHQTKLAAAYQHLGWDEMFLTATASQKYQLSQTSTVSAGRKRMTNSERL